MVREYLNLILLSYLAAHHLYLSVFTVSCIFRGLPYFVWKYINLYLFHQSGYIIDLFVETPRKFITAKLIISTDEDILLALMKIRAYGSKALQ
jgi:hypothetical protein